MVCVYSYDKLYNVNGVAKEETREKTQAKPWNPSNSMLAS